jgi:protein-S-isoprenylcysteine O-methyltransferase Ste14
MSMHLPFRSKFRLNRGPLRSWLVLLGILFIDFHAATFVAGVLMVTFGSAFHFVCKCYLQQNRELTVSGPYRFTRHPFYLANLIVECGLLIIIGNPWIALAYLALWLWIYGRAIRDEEATLAGLFGDAFANYSRCVPRLFPFPGKCLSRAQLSGPTFSLRNRNIAEGAEIQRALRMLSYPVLFLAAAIAHERGLTLLTSRDANFAAALVCFLTLNALGFAVTALLRNRAQSRRARTNEVRRAA